MCKRNGKGRKGREGPCADLGALGGGENACHAGIGKLSNLRTTIEQHVLALHIAMSHLTHRRGDQLDLPGFGNDLMKVESMTSAFEDMGKGLRNASSV